MDRLRDGAARQRQTRLDMKSRHQKVSHAPTHAHTCWHVEGKLPERSSAWRRVGSCFPVGFALTCRSASCTSKPEVSGRKSHRRQLRRRGGDLTAEGSERRIK